MSSSRLASNVIMLVFGSRFVCVHNKAARYSQNQAGPSQKFRVGPRYHDIYLYLAITQGRLGHFLARSDTLGQLIIRVGVPLMPSWPVNHGG